MNRHAHVNPWSTLAVLMISCASPPTIAADAPAANVPQYLQDRPVTRLDQPTQWVTCAWDVEKQDGLAECATVIVPLDYDKPARGDFRLFVKRRKVIGTPTAQVWMMHGGPGASATEGLKRLSYDIPELRPDIQYYGVDHRGIAGSEKLECPEQQSATSELGSSITTDEWPACIAHIKATVGDRLDAFNSTLAAHDVGTLADKYRIKDVPIFVYGGSYGTYLARRYLQLFPKQPRGVILEGVADMKDHMTGYDTVMIHAADDLLAACGKAPACASHFKGSPANAIKQTLKKMESGHCSALKLTPAMVKMVLTGMTFAAPSRVLVPALAYRIDRCDDRDIAVIARTLTTYLAATNSKSYSTVLHNHIALSEMYTLAQSTEQLQKQFDDAALSTGLELSYSKIHMLWPRYARSDLVGREPDYDGPMLMLQGGLDTPSPLARALPVRDRFNGAKQYWAQFPEGAHGMTSRTPTVDGSDCGRSIYLQFVNRPDVRPDMSCISRILPINWNSTPEDAMRFMGTLDIWDGAVETPPTPAAAPRTTAQ